MSEPSEGPFLHGYLSKFGYTHHVNMSPNTRVSANPSILGEIRLTLGDGHGQGLVLSLPSRIADQVIDALVDALEGLRMREAERFAGGEHAS